MTPAKEEETNDGIWPGAVQAAAELPSTDDVVAEPAGKEFREYIAVLRRRRVQILVVAGLLIAVTLVVAVGLPPVYRASATILVQEQEVPPELVRSTITSFADERIQVISQQVMTRGVLLELVEKYDLYANYRGRATSDEILDRMRRDIKLSTIDANISDRSSGRRVNATIAFKISYDSPHPEPAQKVVNELVTLYLNENAKARQQSVAETAAFLAQESSRAADRIREIEANLATFKRRNAGRMPDSSAVNLQLSERTDSELSQIERQIGMLHDRRQALEAQLALVSPSLPPSPLPGITGERILTPADRLRALQAQYTATSAVYGADHPDIRRLQREIAALKAGIGTTVREDTAVDKLKELESELAALKERYADDHPDIQRLRRSIAALRTSGSSQTIVSRPTDKRPVIEPTSRPDNPAYIALTTQIEAFKREQTQLSALRDDLRGKQRAYDSRLLQIPEVEREFRELTRDYENTQTRYREIRAKEMQAQVAHELEKDRKAERFSLGEPATRPQTPISPNRMQIALLGILGSFGGGVGLAWLRDALDPSIKGPLELARLAPVPVLTAIPYIQTRWERVGNLRRRWIIACLILGLVVGLAMAVDSYVKPLPTILDSVARKINF